jgi:hypothetical protein
VGLYGSFTTLGVMIGPPAGVALLQQSGSTAVFTLTLVTALASLSGALLLREPPRVRATAERGAARLHPLVYAAAIATFGLTMTWGSLVTFLPL